MTDGVYCWPEGLAHYINEHDVRLPAEFVAHVRKSHHLLSAAPRPTFDHVGQRDRSWPDSQFGAPIWQPEDVSSYSTSDSAWDVPVDDTWWQSQTGASPADVEATES
jgi:hypothetical protein